jgi:hypothetical protein
MSLAWRPGAPAPFTAKPLAAAAAAAPSAKSSSSSDSALEHDEPGSSPLELAESLLLPPAVLPPLELPPTRPMRLLGLPLRLLLELDVLLPPSLWPRMDM